MMDIAAETRALHPTSVFEARAAAQANWPNLTLDEATFRRHLDALGWGELLPPYVLQVYLACACGQGDEAACRLFDRSYAGLIRSAIKSVWRTADGVEEVQQAVREKLLVGPPKGILKYSGRSSLEAWLRLVVKRVALDAQRAARRSARRDALAMSLCDSSADAIEGELDRRRYAALLQTALSSAVAGLPARDLDVLRLHYASGVGIDALGRVFGVHRATAARWIEKIQSQLRAQLRQGLSEGGRGLSDDELRELWALAACRVELGISDWTPATEPRVEI